MSWATVGARNKYLYIRVSYDNFNYYIKVVLEEKNYNAASFAVELQTKLNYHIQAIKLSRSDPTNIEFTVTYNLVDNMMEITYEDLRTVRFSPMDVVLYSDEDVRAGLWDNRPIRYPESIVDNIRLTETFTMTTMNSRRDYPTYPYECYVNLHPIRNLYLHSSALSSYDIVTNFGMETIVKKIPVRANYNEMLYDASNDGFDYINVTKRTLNRLDFQLTDAYGNPIDLRNNHFSFSLVFQRTNQGPI